MTLTPYVPERSQDAITKFIKKINKQKGLILLAFDDKKIVGLIAGVIKKQSKENLLECVPTKAGRILEVFVKQEYRGYGLGEKLMKRMEEYFKHEKCDVIRIEVFEPNKAAHDFYKKLRYSDRTIDLFKDIG